MKSNNFSQLSAWAELGNSGLRWWQYGTSKASPYKNDRGPIFHSAARASDVCNYFILWHSERLSLLSVAFEKKNTRCRRFSWKQYVWQNRDQVGTIKKLGFTLRLPCFILNVLTESRDLVITTKVGCELRIEIVSNF